MEKTVINYPLISVIVPVYNVSQYIDQCIKSILKQTYTNLEIILVDDGSTDNSGAKCDEYALEDKRIKVIHKKNGGLSSARNAAIDIMTGQYVTYIDSDDYVLQDYIEYLYDLLTDNDADISMCGLKKIYSEKDKLDISIPSSESMNGKDAIKSYLYQKKILACAHCKMYKSSLFDSLRYPVGKYYEDMAVICKLLDAADKVTIGNQQKYYYIQRTDSIMGEGFNPKKMHRIEIAEEIHVFISKSYPDLIKAADARCFLAATQTFREIPRKKEYKCYANLVWKEIVKYRKKVITNIETKLFHKVIGISTYCGRHCLSILGNCYSRLNNINS